MIRLQPPPHGARHDHMVRRFSDQFDRIVALRRVGLGRDDAAGFTARAAVALDVTPPEVTFHGRRGPHTGYCQAPRDRVIEESGDDSVTRWERAKGRPWPVDGMIRFGDPTSLSTIAHELGHHLVNLRDPLSTPPHGKVWVARFDEAAVVVHDLVRRRSAA